MPILKWQIEAIEVEVTVSVFFNVSLFLRGREHKPGRDRDGERGRQRIQGGLCTDSSKPYVHPELRNHEIMT